MKTGRLYVIWVIFVALISIVCVGSARAVPANWLRSDEGLTFIPNSQTPPRLFTFDGRVYVYDYDNTALYVQLYNAPCFGWQQVTLPSDWQPVPMEVNGVYYPIKPVGDYLYASGSDASGNGLWWAGLGYAATLPIWNKVSSTGLPPGAIIRPWVVFNNQLYAEVVTTPYTFDIYRTSDIGKTSMNWTQVVSAGFGDGLNHIVGSMIQYMNYLILVTSDRRTNPADSFGIVSSYGPGILVYESPTGDLNSWEQVNQAGFGSVEADGTPKNPDCGSTAVYNGYLYVGTLGHNGGEVWRYDGTGLNGWTKVLPNGTPLMCYSPPPPGVVIFGCGPSRAMDLVEYNGLLYLAEGYPTGYLDMFDGTTWTKVLSVCDLDPAASCFSGGGFDSLAVLPSKPTPPWGSGPTGDKLFALIGLFVGPSEIWSYPFSTTPPTCTALDQATLTITPKTSTSELLPGATYPVTVKINVGTGFDFGQVFVPLETHYFNFYYGGGGDEGVGMGFVSTGTWTETFGADLSPNHTPPLDPLHPSQITVCFGNSEKAVCDSATHTWADTIPPAITITTPANGAKYLLNQVVPAQYTVYDAVGVLSTTAPVPVGGPIPTDKLGNQTFTVTATDYGKNTATNSATYTVETPAQGTQDLKSGVSNSPIPQGIKNGLNAKLDAAINALNQGDKKAAINILQAFINMVNAQRGKSITSAQADSWIAATQNIIKSINAP